MREDSTVTRGGRRWPVFTILAVIVIAGGAIAFTLQAPQEIATPESLPATTPGITEAVTTTPPGTSVEPSSTGPDDSADPSSTPSKAPSSPPPPPESSPESEPEPEPEPEPKPTAAAAPRSVETAKPVVAMPPTSGQETASTALERTRAAAIVGDASAQLALGTALLEGAGVEVNRPKALAWYMQSAARGNAQAVTARDALFAEMDDGERVRGESLSRSLDIPMPAGWISANGVKVWAPSWYRNGTWGISMTVPGNNGLAHGTGEVALQAHLYGRSSRSYEGTFTDGLLLDEALQGWKFELLETDAYRVHVPVRPKDATALIAIWMQNELAGQGAWLTWWLTSATGTPKGAFLRARIQSDRASGRVANLRLVLTDSELMRQDERQGHAARRAAKKREYEQSKSDEVKF